MIDRLARQHHAVYLLLALYFTVNMLVRLATPASLEFDEGQQLFLAQWLAPGYDSQAPLYNWLQYVVVQVLGDSVLALTLLKNVLLFSSYALFGLAAHMIVRDRALAVIATLGLITIPQIGYEAQRDLTHTVALLFSACLFIYVLARTLRAPSAANYALTGLAIGVGVLSKYNFVLLPAATLLALALDPLHRRRLFDPRMILTVVVAAAVVAPHAAWFAGHVGEATQLTVAKLARNSADDGGLLIGLLALLEAVAAITLPTLAVFAFAFGRSLFRAWGSQSDWTRLLGRILVIATLLLLILLLSGGATYIRHRWLVPLFFLLPVYLCAKLEASGEIPADANRRFGAVVLAIMVLMPTMLGVRPLLGSLGHYSKQNVPYGPAIAEILASNPDRPSVVLASDLQLAGNIRLHAPGIPVALPGYEYLEKPFPFDAAHPVLAIWRGRREAAPLPSAMQAWLDREAGLAGKAPDVREVAVPYHFGRDGDVYRFSYAWIYPPTDP
ncbi:MAG: glycosyltransferase family 39 protein [Pseudomonadota bacterium]|nr:glycosyltransferase family 39 protein [Pseudomonadota bacterium]